MIFRGFSIKNEPIVCPQKLNIEPTEPPKIELNLKTNQVRLITLARLQPETWRGDATYSSKNKLSLERIDDWHIFLHIQIWWWSMSFDKYCMCYSNHLVGWKKKKKSKNLNFLAVIRPLTFKWKSPTYLCTYLSYTPSMVFKKLVTHFWYS